MINHKYKCIFIHINKCAGTSIDRIFNGKNCGHNTALKYKKHFPNEFESYFKFSFVRNPWSKMTSFYHYHVIRGWDLNWDWDRNNYPNFKDFIKTIYSYSREKKVSIFSKKTASKNCHLNDSRNFRISNSIDWLQDEHENILVDFIGKVENLDHDFAKVCKKINMPIPQIPHNNKSKHKHYSEYYDNETQEIVAHHFAKDIEYFGYKFETNT